MPRPCPANRPGTVQGHAHDITMDTLPATPLTHLYYSATRGAPSDDQAKISPADPGHRDWPRPGRLWRRWRRRPNYLRDGDRADDFGQRESSRHRFGNSAPASRFGSAGTPANNARGGTHGDRRGQCYGDGSSRWSRFRIPEQHASRRCVEPCGIEGQRDGIDGAYNCLHEHREPEEAVRQRIYPLHRQCPDRRLCNPLDARAVFRVSSPRLQSGILG